MPTRPRSLPPGPPSPAFWQLLRYTHLPLPFLEGCARAYGTPFTVRLAGYGRLVLLTDAESIQDVFRGDPHALHSGEGNEFLSVTVGRNSVLVLDEEAHARQRRVLLPPLKGERMRAFFDAMQAETLAEVRAWPVGRGVRTDGPMRRITLRVILRAVLGLEAGPRLDDFARRVERMLAFGRSEFGLLLAPIVPLWLVKNARWAPFFRQVRQLDEALFAYLAELRGRPAADRPGGVAADLLAATHADGSPLSDVEVRDAVVTMLTAGHETTAVALAWALEQIVPRPDVVGRLGEELRRVTGGGPPRADQLAGLSYLDAAIREGLRVRTLLPFVVRLTKRPFVAGSREYPPGVLLAPSNHLVHRREDLYPEPRRFRPERFLTRKFAGHEWFPFGGGNRTCLGMAFALYEMKVVLATLLASVELARPAGRRSRPVRRGLALVPDDGAEVIVMRRL